MINFNIMLNTVNGIQYNVTSEITLMLFFSREHLLSNNSNILFAHRSNHNTRKVTQLKSRNRLDTREDTVLSG